MVLLRLSRKNGFWCVLREKKNLSASITIYLWFVCGRIEWREENGSREIYDESKSFGYSAMEFNKFSEFI